MISLLSETRQKWVGSALFLGLVALGSVLIWRSFGEQNPAVIARERSDRSNLGTEIASVSPGLSPRNAAQTALPTFASAPDFSLTERNGKKFSSGDLKGKVWIADFIFTSSAGQCPMMSSHMKKLQTLFPKTTGLELVSFTVDPARDKPSVLSQYADRYEAEKDRWFFLTGPQTEINRILKGLLLSGVDEPAMHSSRFILVDRTGQVRGYYDSTDSAAMNQLVRDARLLVQQTSLRGLPQKRLSEAISGIASSSRQLPSRDSSQ